MAMKLGLYINKMKEEITFMRRTVCCIHLDYKRNSDAIEE
jgi:hypothetical protein